ncbi:fluoride efflux transporter CrcB [Gordonia sp. zg691]|uniref:Fluoride-specific ion channel FluC n=1 Tax=Gordonia jinghuaiqii TaxID=2758710 RepID=A0A7D7QZ99_9ACTN|nr:fluoride efflux transporter CrcB [Gordonia jinghuaiqii]MBD0862211.1 fluoride efflux transporter CrcB [Gordonia jinghuaiqii]MCR5978565.1 fluoride efflux transporter CrcB [Gordonia jinghuaiqii]QMT02888.1 fluoride efflux transporter CrcB [Gordonia jinghuaiqii]
MMVLLMIIAGGVGALARYLVGKLVTHYAGDGFPWGTLVINVSGSLLLGFLSGLSMYHGFTADTRFEQLFPTVVLGSGFCGGYTTFSTFTVDTVKLGDQGRLPAAVANVLLSLVIAVGGAVLGLAIAAATA